MTDNKVYLDFLAPSLTELWARFPKLPWTSATNPIYPTWIKKQGVLVLGLNPSDNPAHREWTSYEPDYTSAGYFRRMGKFMDQVSYAYQLLLEQVHQQPLQQLFVPAELECSHLDLLYLRATQQKALQAQIWREPQAAGFVWEQLQLTKQLLIQAQPVVLVVANRLGRLLTGFEKNADTKANEWMGLQFSTTSNAQGAYRLIGSTTSGLVDNGEAYKLIGTPVFFTNSFAGTSPRSHEGDAELAQQIATAYLQEADSHFERWQMR